MTWRRKRVGVIGAGQHMRRSHIAVWGDNFELSAICDPSTESREETMQLVRHDVPVCDSPAELAKRDDVDVVMIGSLDKAHAEQAEEVVLVARKPVLCEKPLAIDGEGLARVRKTLTFAEQEGIYVASCHPRRRLIKDPLRDSNPTVDLPYGWIKANLRALEDRFGPLRFIGLNSNYPRPSKPWKSQRSFLADKFVHDIDYLRFAFGDQQLRAEPIFDSSDHYQVRGELKYGANLVEFDCLGTRLHGADDEYMEIVTLLFEHGTCVVYTKPGIVRFYDQRSGERWEMSISPMNAKGYDRVFAALMQDFADAFDGGPRAHSYEDLWVNTEAVVVLANGGEYRYG